MLQKTKISLTLRPVLQDLPKFVEILSCQPSNPVRGRGDLSADAHRQYFRGCMRECPRLRAHYFRSLRESAARPHRLSRAPTSPTAADDFHLIPPEGQSNAGRRSGKAAGFAKECAGHKVILCSGWPRTRQRAVCCGSACLTFSFSLRAARDARTYHLLCYRPCGTHARRPLQG